MSNHAIWPYESDKTLRVGMVPPETFDRTAVVEHTEYRHDPIRWAVEKLGIPEHTIRWSINPGYVLDNEQLHQWDGTPDPMVRLFEGVRDGRVGHDVVVESGTGTGKSYAMAILILWFLACFKDAEVYTFAPTEDQLKLYIWKNIQELWPRFQSYFPTAELTTLTIRMYGGINERWSAHGYPVQIRAGEKVSVRASGMHATDMMLVYEETPGIDFAVTEAGRNTCTAPHNFRVAIGNPTHQLDTLHRMAEEPGTTAIRMSGLDHPNVVSGNSGLIPGAVSKPSIESRRAQYGETDPVYQARVRGFSPEQASNALIRLDWLKAAAKRYDAWLLEHENERVPITGKGVDAANSEHGDQGAIVDFSDNVCVRIDAFPCPDSNLLGARVVRECVRDGTPPERVGADAIGVGAGTVNEARRLNFIIQALYAGGKPMPMVERTPDGQVHEWSPDVNLFDNLRAQMSWQAREDLRTGIIAVPADKEFWEEATAITFKDEGKKVKIDPKDLIKSLLGRSPNKWDAFVMANWVRSRAVELSKTPEPKENQAMGYDYKKHRQRERPDADEEFDRMIQQGYGDPLAGRYDIPYQSAA